MTQKRAELVLYNLFEICQTTTSLGCDVGDFLTKTLLYKQAKVCTLQINLNGLNE